MHIIALGGTTRANSTTEKLLAIAGEAAAPNGAKITYFDGAYISALPHYGGPGHVDGMGREMIEAVRNADGIIIASPGYHGSISGMIVVTPMTPSYKPNSGKHAKSREPRWIS